MPIKDNRSDLEVQLAYVRISSAVDETVNTVTIDTADYDNGVSFIFASLEQLGGTVTVTQILENDIDDVGSATVVPADNLIGTLPAITTIDNTATSLNTVGVFGTKRYIWATLQFVVNPNTVTFTVSVNKTPEIRPAIHPNDE